MLNFFTSGGGSGEIRGVQIANKLKGNINPKEFSGSDINIYIKDYPTGNIPNHVYIDVVEDSRGLRWVKNHPEVGIIASSKMILDHIIEITKGRKDIILIPQHHCNFDRWTRAIKGMKVAGIIGNKGTYQGDLYKLSKELESNGIKLITLIKKKFKDREEVVEFYKKIDVQIVYREDMSLRNPLKLINAMSFGIPTIAYAEPSFVMEELPFMPVRKLDDIIIAINMLKFPTVYRNIAEMGLKAAENYHIDVISKLYLKLV